MFLLKNRFDPGNVNSKRGWLQTTTPLHEAVKQNDAYITSKLLMFGADLESRDLWGRTAYHYEPNFPWQPKGLDSEYREHFVDHHSPPPAVPVPKKPYIKTAAELQRDRALREQSGRQFLFDLAPMEEQPHLHPTGRKKHPFEEEAQVKHLKLIEEARAKEKRRIAGRRSELHTGPLTAPMKPPISEVHYNYVGGPPTALWRSDYRANLQAYVHSAVVSSPISLFPGVVGHPDM
eukprot:g7816.t1